MATIDKPSNVDRSLLQSPDELFTIPQEAEELSVQVEETPTEDEGAEVVFGEEETTTIGEEPEDFYDNLVEQLDSATISEL